MLLFLNRFASLVRTKDYQRTVYRPYSVSRRCIQMARSQFIMVQTVTSWIAMTRVLARFWQ